MRRVCVTLFLCAVCQVAVPSSALAWWHFFDELSGPGPFNGAEADVRVLCWSKPRPRNRIEKIEENTREKDPKRHTIAVLVTVLTPCVFDTSTKKFFKTPLENERRASFNVDVTYFFAKHTHLQYEDGSGHHVHTLAIRPTAWKRVARWWEVGAGVGLYRFMGNGFDSFNRVSLEPLTDVKPFALANAIRHHHPDDEDNYPDSQLDLMVSVRFGLIYFPQAFDAVDFGAKPGSFHRPRELKYTISVIFDWDPLARKIRRPCACPPPKPDGVHDR